MEQMNSKFYPKSRIWNPKSIPVPRHDFPVSPQRYSIPPPGCARLGTKIDICEIAIHISRIAAKYIAKIIHIYLIRRHRPGERENQIIFKKRLYRFVVFFLDAFHYSLINMVRYRYHSFGGSGGYMQDVFF